MENMIPIGRVKGTMWFPITANTTEAPEGAAIGDIIVNGGTATRTAGGIALAIGSFAPIKSITPFQLDSAKVGNIRGIQGPKGDGGDKGDKGEAGKTGDGDLSYWFTEDEIQFPYYTGQGGSIDLSDHIPEEILDRAVMIIFSVDVGGYLQEWSITKPAFENVVRCADDYLHYYYLDTWNSGYNFYYNGPFDVYAYKTTVIYSKEA